MSYSTRYRRGDREAVAAFMEAIFNANQNYAFDAIELLSDELVMLDKEFLEQKIDAKIEGEWIATDLSFLMTLKCQHETLLRLLVIPFPRTEVQMIIVDQAREDNAEPRTVIKFENLDRQECQEALFSEVRKLIKSTLIDATPSYLRDQLDKKLTETFGGIYMTPKERVEDNALQAVLKIKFGVDPIKEDNKSAAPAAPALN